MMDEKDAKPNASRYFQAESMSIFDDFKQQSSEDLNLKSEESAKQPLYFSPPTTSFSYIGTQGNLPNIESINMGESLLTGTATSSIDGIPLPSGGVNSDEDRTCDVWIPSKATRESLDNLDSSTKMEKNQLVFPGIAVKEDFGDPIRNLVETYLGEEALSKRQALQATDVTQDDRGLRQLVAAGCYHAAVNLTTQLLNVYGQGNRRVAGQISKHTVHSLQLWFTRISLLVKLRRFSFAEVEVEPLGDLDSPDLYFEFYPELYGGRKGSLVPFSFRLLVAELPQYLGKHSQTIERLCKIMAVCNQILENLSNGLCEDGSEPAKKGLKESAVRIWTSRRARVLYSLVRCSVGLKDFRLASALLQRLLKEETDMAGLFSAVGRLYLHLGDIDSAQEAFKRYLEHSPTGVIYDPVQGLLHSSFIASAQNDFENAAQILHQAHKVAPENALVINNLGVSMMFVGQIREAIQLVEKALFGNPEKLLHEALVLNLATMYELESSAAHKKKLNILSLVAAHKGDGFNVAALKLQV